MTKRTKKAGIVGKYGTRYGASLRKKIKRWRCLSTPSTSVSSVGRGKQLEFGDEGCGKVKAGGAYTMNTASAVTVRSTIRRLREQTEA